MKECDEIDEICLVVSAALVKVRPIVQCEYTNTTQLTC